MAPRKRGRGRGGAASSAATAKKTPAKRGSTVKNDDEPPPKLAKDESFRTKLKRIIKEEEKTNTSKTSFKPDSSLLALYPKRKVVVYKDFSCMLNQTNIGQNNNKFYVIQGIDMDGNLALFTKWGRVGESGQQDLSSATDETHLIKAFEKKFKDKTKNDWKNRENFTPVSGKYTMIDMSQESDDEEEDVVDAPKQKLTASKNVISVACSLDNRTQLMIKLIFNVDMFTNTMEEMNLDIRKMPLGKLKKTQILKGLQTLLDLEKAIDENKKNSVLMELSSKFYTLIPHNFGRVVPPVISDKSIVDKKKEMIMTLTDIEIAQAMQKEQGEDEKIHPLNVKYDNLECELELVDKKSDEFKILQKYASVNKQTRKGPLLDVWRVNRKKHRERFNKHDNIDNRKLLWHGTNVAVVAAILKEGLRIMPHSGGLVGRGIYFASEHAKSSWYVRPHFGKFENESNIGFMFLVEVALGKSEFVKTCQSYKAAPKGYDSVVARGQCEPDPKKDVIKEFDGKDVIVPVGAPVKQNDFKDSGFSQSEYLIYKESQAKIRYLLKFSFN